MRSDLERLIDIQEAITKIEMYSAARQTTFETDELIQIWIVHHLQIIGEASNALSERFINQHSEIAWAEIIAFRNVLVHEYFRINLELVWQIVVRDLPTLKANIEALLQKNF